MGPNSRADDEIRTRDPHLGKVMLYQLSHVRTCRDPVHLVRPGDVLNSSGFHRQLKFRFRSLIGLDCGACSISLQ